MGFFQDISPIFKKREIVFIESYKESVDVYTFIFEKEKDLKWKAGQHGVFSILHKTIKKPTRPFSVASAPSESMLKLSMKISDNPSDFKRAMLELKQGMKISMRGPIGPLYIDDNSPSLLIAGGIGITPFRSIVKEIENEGNESANQISLLYIDSKGSFIYKDELNELSKNTSINVSYLTSREDLYKEVDHFSSKYRNTAKYYLGGSKTMVDTITSYLKKKQVFKRNIKKDVFIGYK
ncbi:FAD-dependent oxidoreductase [Neobacillus sp. WH10]|uniref:FAD-dependent oxidoreductase n=1 Tax=Neobacillus sp. WH10 TaxID=3047873 RepID=UPI0024C19C40|nr:FAD-dependent oxidoreductase [Neobacillus sp. WH10]WHY77825.1 FAD-dependent oxidoreductase [Neobacillus sp. WH10]